MSEQTPKTSTHGDLRIVTTRCTCGTHNIHNVINTGEPVKISVNYVGCCANLYSLAPNQTKWLYGHRFLKTRLNVWPESAERLPIFGRLINWILGLPNTKGTVIEL